MSQLRKLRRHARPPVAFDFETRPPTGSNVNQDGTLVIHSDRRFIDSVRSGGLSAEHFARHCGLTVEQAQALLETYRAGSPAGYVPHKAGTYTYTGRQPSRPELWPGHCPEPPCGVKVEP